MYILEAKKGMVLHVFPQPTPGGVIEMVTESIGDWRGGGFGGK